MPASKNTSIIDQMMRDVIYGLIMEAMLVNDIRQAEGIVVNQGMLAVKAMKRIVAAIQVREMLSDLQREKEMAMPNSVSFSDEGTVVRAMTAIAGDDDLNMQQVLGVLNRLTKADILFREPAEEKPRGPRTKNADGTTSENEVGVDPNPTPPVAPPTPDAPVTSPQG